MLGALYLAYDLYGRQHKILHRCVWGFSSGFLYAAVLLVSCLFYLAPARLTSGYPFEQVWRLVAVFSGVGLFMQVFISSFPPESSSPVSWPRLTFSIVWGGLLVGAGATNAPQGSSPLLAALIFALPSIIVLGTLNGFAPAIQRWILHLPEKRVAVIGALLIFCAFALALVQPLLGFLGVPFQ